jgi:hypothetical protein
MTKILAFSGRKQSGKSTGGEYIEHLIKTYNLPISYKLYSFADPLKQDICINLLGLTHEQCYGTDEQKNTLTSVKWKDIPGIDCNRDEYMTAREVMEVVGTKIFRKIKNNIWVDATLDKIDREQYDLAIVLDNRFPNEVDGILNVGGFVIRLTRDLFNSNAEAEVALDKNNYDWSKFSLVVDNQNLNLDDKNNQIFHFLKTEGILPL